MYTSPEEDWEDTDCVESALWAIDYFNREVRVG